MFGQLLSTFLVCIIFNYVICLLFTIYLLSVLLTNITWFVAWIHKAIIIFVSVISSTVSILTCLCWISSIIVKQYKKYKFREDHEFDLRKKIASLQRSQIYWVLSHYKWRKENFKEKLENSNHFFHFILFYRFSQSPLHYFASAKTNI